MTENLVVVESPTKAKSLAKYLGRGFEVLASYGHVRDLLPKQGAVDPEHDFHMIYALIEKNKKHVEAIVRAAKRAKTVYLATDPDREGEAIAWHLAEILQAEGISGPFWRLVYHEVTEKAVREALKQPRPIALPLVDAQKARRALDYLVGFHLSPLLWRKVRPGLSAGRVQSAALKMIVAREEEIEGFVKKEYWTVHLLAEKEGAQIRASLARIRGEPVEKFTFENEGVAREAVAYLEKAVREDVSSPGRVKAAKVEKRKKEKKPPPPFITSTLQQEAAKRLGMSPERTMRVAQKLFEGIDVASERVGLITYMRTDSTLVSEEAIAEMREFIAGRFGKDFVPGKPVLHKTRSKNAQEAHEAIRPTSVLRTPEDMARFLDEEERELYALIWRRALASQMASAVFEAISVDLAAGGEENLFRATGQRLLFAGYLLLFDENPEENQEQTLLALKKGEELAAKEISCEQHFTEPPPRFNDASLIKALEEHGIGRPSTYASILSTLFKREYVTRDKKRLLPTDVGKVVARFLGEHFSRYVDYGFTAKMEDALDEISTGKKPWKPVLQGFWAGFSQTVEEKKSTVIRKEVLTEPIGEACPKCGAPLIKRLGKRGSFIACSAYPQCRYTRPLEGEIPADHPCPKCGSELLLRMGARGKFFGCSAYPRCDYAEPLEKPQDTGISCPQCQKGTLVQRKSRFGKFFFGCSAYPGCTYATWNPPLPEPCPACGWPITTLKISKRRGAERVCPQKECGWSAPAEVTPASEAI